MDRGIETPLLAASHFSEANVGAGKSAYKFEEDSASHHQPLFDDIQSGVRSDEAGLGFGLDNTIERKDTDSLTVLSGRDTVAEEVDLEFDESDAESRQLIFQKLRSNSVRRPGAPAAAAIQLSSHVPTHPGVGAFFSLPWKALQAAGASIKSWAQSIKQQIGSDPKYAVLSVKAGIAALLVSILCVQPEPYDSFSSMGLWALATVDMTFESNVGAALSKGINRVLGTLAAGILAVGINHIAPLSGIFHPYFVLICVFVSSVILTFYKYRPPFKDRWNYAFVISMLTFHILIITGYQNEEKIITPLLRFLMILLGFMVANMVQLAFKPAYAGDALHTLVSKNFHSAANVLERCIEEYEKGSVLPQVPDLFSGRRKGDNSVPSLYHQVVMSDAEVDKHLAAVPFEPCHGKFFYGYPWHLYDDITDNLRYAVYDIIALDTCLRAEIQAPVRLRLMLTTEMGIIGRECARALKALGTGMETLRWVDCGPILRTAEEAALVLQHKICKNLSAILGVAKAHAGVISPFQFSYDASAAPPPDRLIANLSLSQSPRISPRSSPRSSPPRGASVFRELLTVPEGPERLVSADTPDQQLTSSDSEASLRGYLKAATAAEGQPEGTGGAAGNSRSGGSGSGERRDDGGRKDGSVNGGLTGSNGDHRGDSDGGWRRRLDDTISDASQGSAAAAGKPPLGVRLGTDGPASSKKGSGTSSGQEEWKHDFIMRQESMGRQWEGTVERISALSLLKFSSTLLELVAKMKFVVEATEQLAREAHFEGAAPHADGVDDSCTGAVLPTIEVRVR
eukprot:jgi/Mesen1/1199/ME000128S00182